MRRVLLEHTDRVIASIVAETGKTYEDALLSEVAHVIRACGYWGRAGPGFLADERLSRRGPSRRKLVLRHRPRGVVGVIGPSNFPLIGSFGEALAALMTGNAVVLKPSPLTPLTSLLVVELLTDAGLEAEVVQVATGGQETAEALVDASDYVTFTGSTAAGRAVAERAGRSLTPVGLELGGKDALVVLADADLERAATVATYYGMPTAGQVCTSVERVYVETSVYDAFVARVTDKVRALRPSATPARPGSGKGRGRDLCTAAGCHRRAGG